MKDKITEIIDEEKKVFDGKEKVTKEDINKFSGAVASRVQKEAKKSVIESCKKNIN